MDKQIALKEWELGKLKRNFFETNEKAIMYAVGELTEEEYAETKAKRKALLDEINEKEAEIEALKGGEQ